MRAADPDQTATLPRRARWWGWLVAALVVAVGVAGFSSLFANARAQAQANNCQSNVKQIVLGMIMYSSDNNDHLPPTTGWSLAILPYDKNVGIYGCPADDDLQRKAAESEAKRRLLSPSRERAFSRIDPLKLGLPLDPSYTMNAALAGHVMGSLPEPKATILLFEGSLPAGERSDAIFRHAGRLNVGYPDGHAQLLSQREFEAARFSP